MSALDKFRRFKELHVKGNPIMLYNIWNAGSAQALVEAGAPIVATGSKPLALSQGYPDGEVIPFEVLLQTVLQIVNAVSVPVSIDFEGGYAKLDHELLAKRTASLLETGIIGVNFEDQVVGSQGLYDIETQAKRVAIVRKAAQDRNAPLFINARTDLFLKEKDKQKHAGLMQEAIMRARAYQDAGADGFFAPGLAHPELISDLCERIDLPVNIIKTPTAPAKSELAASGVARISYGPYAYLELMNTFQQNAGQALG